MYYKKRYPFIGAVEKLPKETEEDFYMYWSYSHINFDNSRKLSEKSLHKALNISSRLDKEKNEKGLFKKCKYGSIGNVVCLEKEEFREFIDLIEVEKEKSELKNIFNFLEKKNLFKGNWIVLNVKEYGELYYCDDDEEEEEDEENSNLGCKC